MRIRDDLEGRGCQLPPIKPKSSHFDSNCITPGTEFMARLAVCLQYYIHDRMNTNPAWQNISVSSTCTCTVYTHVRTLYSRDMGLKSSLPILYFKASHAYLQVILLFEMLFRDGQLYGFSQSQEQPQKIDLLRFFCVCQGKILVLYACTNCTSH